METLSLHVTEISRDGGHLLVGQIVRRWHHDRRGVVPGASKAGLIGRLVE